MNANLVNLNLVQIEELAWKELRTVVVLGPVSRAVWWPPNADVPGVLAAGSVEQAREFLLRIKDWLLTRASAAAPPANFPPIERNRG